MAFDVANGGSQKPNWSSGLCSCRQDCSTCFLTCLCPCITFGRIAVIIDEGKSSCFGQCCCYALLMVIQCQWLYSCMYREKLRTKFGFTPNSYGDCCAHYWCDRCALRQEYCELKSRGLDPSKGWIAPPTTTAPMPPSMSR